MALALRDPLQTVPRHCPWLLADEKGASDEGEHGCLLKDCSGNLQRVYFALDASSFTVPLSLQGQG